MAQLSTELKMREGASLLVLRFIVERGEDETTQIVKGAACAFAKALGGLIGHVEARRMMLEAIPPAQLHLVHVNDGAA